MIPLNELKKKINKLQTERSALNDEIKKLKQEANGKVMKLKQEIGSLIRYGSQQGTTTSQLVVGKSNSKLKMCC